MQKTPYRSQVTGAALALGLTLFAAVAGLQACASGGALTENDMTSSGSAGACSQTCPEGTTCNPDTGECVGCLEECAEGQYCDETGECLDGCGDDADCPGQLCDPDTHTCEDCVEDGDCEVGFVCTPDGDCAPGCSDVQPCPSGLNCCGDICYDLQSDADNCGDCGNVCPELANATVACQAATCQFVDCDEGYADCNLDQSDGCEHDLATGDCSCEPGSTTPCYDGPIGTEGVGECVGGTSTCNADGTGWGACIGQVMPAFDICGDGLNNDCDNGNDDPPDSDMDGWGPCDGDCCELITDCAQPELVNPGAFEVDGNTLDDDCDGTADNVPPTCDTGLASNSAASLDFAKALDLCQQTQENPADLNDKTWGVISSGFYRADGTGTPAFNQKSIRTGFGSGVVPLQGDAITVLSTGIAAAQSAPNNSSPGFGAFQGGQQMGTTSGVPSDWLAANNNNFPNAPGCPDPQNGTVANDPVMLKLRVRAPTNAKSFSVSTFFYSSEYPEFVCSPWNDFFLALLDSNFMPGPMQDPNPSDKNLATYASGNQLFPLGVNLAHGNTGLFSQCLNGPTGCGSGAVSGTTSTCQGTAQLSGTGFDQANPPSQFSGDPGWCAQSNLAGGGTGWLALNGNVAAGEVIELRFVTWDTGDPWYDTVVLLDNFVWSLEASEPGVHDTP